MLYIFPGKKDSADEKHSSQYEHEHYHTHTHEKHFVNCPCLEEKPEDWPFMEESEQRLAETPDTWKRYPATPAGAMGIIEMEYNELKKAMTEEDVCHELVDLASACLYAWRMRHNMK